MYEELRQLIAVHNRPLVLVGMMGTGKSHFGRMMADALGLDYFDTDMLVEEKAGCTIAEIFERWGEESFRSVEAKTVQELVSGAPCVISTGGGAVMNRETADMIFEGAISIWITATPEAILQRVGKNKKRPLLACENPQDVLQQIMRVREPVYARARFRLSSEEGKAETVLAALLSEIQDDLQQRAA